MHQLVLDGWLDGRMDESAGGGRGGRAGGGVVDLPQLFHRLADEHDVRLFGKLDSPLLPIRLRRVVRPRLGSGIGRASIVHEGVPSGACNHTHSTHTAERCAAGRSRRANYYDLWGCDTGLRRTSGKYLARSFRSPTASTKGTPS